MPSAATPTKLPDGRWGAKVKGSIAAGDTITITTRADKSWDATVDRVLRSDGDMSVCSTVRSTPSSRGRSSSRRSSTCRMSGCQEPATVGRLCARCDFDENDC